MADDGSMHIKTKQVPAESSFSDIARHELSLTARAFFAPVVGTFHVMRGLIRHESRDESPKPAPKNQKAA